MAMTVQNPASRGQCQILWLIHQVKKKKKKITTCKVRQRPVFTYARVYYYSNYCNIELVKRSSDLENRVGPQKQTHSYMGM